MQQNWFKSWFDSPYYHLLYNHRDYSEAQRFIATLFEFLNLPKRTEVLDLACGKGRHAMQIHKLGYDVMGVDLSPQSIESANSMAEPSLSFKTGDMRELPFFNDFDLIVNLFTSFGYFQQEGDNIKVIESIARALKPKGQLVLDYLNVTKVEKTLPSEQKVKRGDIIFHVRKEIHHGFIVKTIQFEDGDKRYEFKEHVKLLRFKDFKKIFIDCGFEVSSTFGDYELNLFDEKTSDRLIFIVQKSN
jgi:SAM-dependent methyltransferase